MQNRKYLLSIEAENDLKAIWNYTLDNWGEKQANKYTLQLGERFEWLVENMQFGKKRDEIQKGLYTYPDGNHIIVYRKSNVRIEIARILHQGMDIEQHI